MEFMIEKEHVINILKNANSAVKSKNISLLSELSNQTIHSASIYQDPDSVALAVTIYTMSKIFGNEMFKSSKKWDVFVKKVSNCLSQAARDLEKNNLSGFRKEIIKIREDINLFGHLREYIKDVFRRASINKASRIYEHGISRAETAELLGITQWELASYAISPFIMDSDLTLTKSIKERIKFTEELFK
jgi:hypothetical protein